MSTTAVASKSDASKTDKTRNEEKEKIRRKRLFSIFSRGKSDLPRFSGLSERLYYTVLYAMYMYGNKARDRVFMGFRCREYEDDYVYVARAMGKYLCTRYYFSNLLYWLSGIARCRDEYGSKSLAIYIYVKKFPNGFSRGFKRRIKAFFSRYYPVFFEALEKWRSVSECDGDSRARCMDTLYDLEHNTELVDGFVTCPSRSLLHIRVEGGEAHVVYTGYL